MPLNIRTLSEELIAKAQIELGEDPKRLEEDLQSLKTWLKKQPHLTAREDDQFLVSFLRGCKFSLQKAKEKIDLYYTLRSACPDFFGNRDPLNPKINEILQLGVITFLPLTDGGAGPRINLIRFGLYDPKKVPLPEFMKVMIMIHDVAMLEDDNLIIAGELTIIDMNNMNLSAFMSQMTPSLMKKMMMIKQDASPLREKGVHYVNVPSGFDILMNLVRTFMSEKVKSRLHFHGSDMESLYKQVPKRLLPTEYGGDAGPINDLTDVLAKKIEDKRDWFLEDVRYGCDERKRVGAPKTAETLFGIEGSFRKLTVD